MRRLVPFSEASKLRYQAYDHENRLLVSDDFFTDAAEAGYFIKDADAVGYYCILKQNDVPLIHIYFNDSICFEDAYRALSMLSEACIRRYHPAAILALHDQRNLHLLQASCYYQKGKYYQKKIEPWRYTLNDAVFDEEGYIINQGAMDKIPFGWFNTMRKGCGWIAAYNLLKMCGHEQTMQETAEALSKYTLLGGMMGQELYTLLVYLRRKGLNCWTSLSLDSSALKCMDESRYGILLYTHTQGAHYTAYRNLGSHKMQFYNAVYGQVNHIESGEDFLKKRELFPFSSVLYVK